MDESDELDVREQIARIDRSMAEYHKLAAEEAKLRAEDTKLRAEAAKLNRDRWLAPVLAIAAVIGGLLGTASFIASLILKMGAGTWPT